MSVRRPKPDPQQELALDTLRCVVAGCLAGMRELPALLGACEDTGEGRPRAQVLPLLGANALAQRHVWERHGVLRARLPGAVQADVGVEYLQGVNEALALLAEAADDPLLPGAEDLARWTADPQMLAWLQRTSGGVPGDVLAWADAAREDLAPAGVGALRNAEVEQAVRAEVGALPSGYRALAESYADPATRRIASDAAWDRLARLARLLRELKGPSCRLTQFDGPAVWSAFAVLHQVFASLALIAQGEEPAGMLLAPDEVDRHAARCVS
jgi:hypothetical protein